MREGPNTDQPNVVDGKFPIKHTPWNKGKKGLQIPWNKAVKMLVSLSEEQKQALDEIRDAERLVEKANQKYNATMASIGHVCKHLELRPHFIIRQGEKIYQITPEFQAHISVVDYEF